VAGLSPDLLGELIAFSQTRPLSWISGGRFAAGEGEEKARKNIVV